MKCASLKLWLWPSYIATIINIIIINYCPFSNILFPLEDHAKIAHITCFLVTSGSRFGVPSIWKSMIYSPVKTHNKIAPLVVISMHSQKDRGCGNNEQNVGTLFTILYTICHTCTHWYFTFHCTASKICFTFGSNYSNCANDLQLSMPQLTLNLTYWFF